MADCSGPGPGAYSPEKCPPMNHSLRPAAFTMKKRTNDHMSGDGPGPIYLIPSCLGPKVPDKTAMGAFTMLVWKMMNTPTVRRYSSPQLSIFIHRASRHDKDFCDSGPGPAAYGNQNFNLIKRRLPAYSLAARHTKSEVGCGPGPRYYPEYSGGKNPPKFSFGIKHSECAPPAVTELDDE